MHRAVVMVSSLLLVGCSTLPPAKATYSFDRRCLPAAMELRRMPVADFERPASSKRPSAPEEAASKLYSRIAVHIADVLDVLPLLNRLAHLEIQQAPPSDIERARRKLTTRLDLAGMEVSSTVAELACEVQRADEVQDRLKQVQNTRSTTQTILGVIFGGLANILSGGLSIATGGDAGNIASVAGGVLEVLFGTSANFTKVRQEFSHPHNHLQAFWDGAGKAQEFFSPAVWRFLTEPNIRDAEGHSLRDVLVNTWDEEGRLGKPGSEEEKRRKALLFGKGGIYDSDDLHVREAMLQQLESSVQLMHQDLETLFREALLRQALEEEQA